MIYMVCPTCKTLLGHKEIPYYKGLKEICNKKLSEKQAEIEKGKLLDRLQIKNICCRIRVINFVRKVELLK